MHMNCKAAFLPNFGAPPAHMSMHIFLLNPYVLPHAQVENATYVWLPLLPKEDGTGYTLQKLDRWRPSDFREQAGLPAVYSSAAGSADKGLSAAEQAWVDGLLTAKQKEQDRNTTVATVSST